MAWYAILSALAIYVVLWRRRYHVAVDPGRWPDYLVSNGMPLFLLGVMLLPRIKNVFTAAARGPTEIARESGARELAPAPALAATPAASERASSRIVSLLCLLLLIVVASTLVVDLADWGSRLLFDAE
jgi:hypothetical protein